MILLKILFNVCRGRNLLDLAVIKRKNTVNNITLARPMIDFYKNIVYNFAHINEVPYFKDTTPLWSIRGKYRNNVYKNLEYTFGENVKSNLISLAKQSDEWNELIMKQLIQPFLDKVKHNSTNNCIEFDIKNYLNYPLCFWNVVFAKLFYQYNKNCPSRKGILTFMNSIPSNSKVSISDDCLCKVKNNSVLITFKANNT